MLRSLSAGSGQAPAITVESSASRPGKAVASGGTRWQAAPIGIRNVPVSTHGTFAACSTCAAIAASESSRTKLPFQYCWSPGGTSSSKSWLSAG